MLNIIEFINGKKLVQGIQACVCEVPCKCITIAVLNTNNITVVTVNNKCDQYQYKYNLSLVQLFNEDGFDNNKHCHQIFFLIIEETSY